MGLFYMCAPHIYLLAPSLVMKKKEEKICEKSLVTSPLPLVTHCPDLSLLSGGVCGGDLSMTPGVTLLMPFHEFLRALWRKKNILSFPMHSILQPLGLFWEGFVQIDY